MTDLQGKNFVAVHRLSDTADRTIADVGETCERVPAAKSGGTVSDALARLLASGHIAPKATGSPATSQAPDPAELEDQATTAPTSEGKG